ncbi:MAG: hypothetical protein KAG28_07210 [Cocleimonas sp.]|nr:hypothetical protein [Cocleimonas sp.]
MKKIILITTLLLTTFSVQADILSIGTHARIAKQANMPKRGISMQSVRKHYGKARRIYRSKGKAHRKAPRITRWEYAKFTVYFERKHVLHTVVHLR